MDNFVWRNRQNAKSQHQVEAWKKAMERMVQMQGSWDTRASNEPVARGNVM